MPELPEVETVRSGLLAALAGRRVQRVELYRPDLRWPIPTARVRGLAGRRLTGIARRSKYLILEFGGPSPPCALVHLGMSGRLFVTPLRGRAAPDRQQHEHWRLFFADRVLRYVDPRRFGVLDVVPKDRVSAHRLLAGLGREPLDDTFDGAWLFAATRLRTAPIKSFLMDGRRLVGVGNIYASEALFRAGIRPTRAAGRLTRAECDRLATAIQDTLRDALAAGGTTLRDYRRADEDLGSFQLDLGVYGRAREACRRCGTPVKRIVQLGRATFFCPGCQR